MADNTEKTKNEATTYDLTLETMFARYERLVHIVIKSLLAGMLILAIVAIAIIISQYNIQTETVTVDSSENGIANYIGEQGDIYNGESYSKENLGDKSGQEENSNNTP